MHRRTGPGSPHALLARHTRALAFRWVDDGLFVAWRYCGVRFRICYAGQPHVLNINGPTPLLEFEVKPPVSQSLESLSNAQPELDTDRNAMPGYWHTDPPENPDVRAGYVELIPHFATPFRAEISQRRGPNFPAQAAGQSDEGEISRLVRLAKPGFCSEKKRATFSSHWRKRVSDSLQNGLSGPINLSAAQTDRSPRRLLNALVTEVYLWRGAGKFPTCRFPKNK